LSNWHGLYNAKVIDQDADAGFLPSTMALTPSR